MIGERTGDKHHLVAPAWRGLDIPGFYQRYFRPGMVDVSRSNPEPLPLDLAPLRVDALASVRPPGGTPGLRAAIAGRYRNLGPEDILVCSGASEALVALALSLGRGAEVVVAPGAYPSFSEVLRVTGGTTHASLDEAAAPDAALSSQPDVPSGRRSDVQAFIEACHRRGAIPIVDEVYRHIVLDGEAAPPAAADLDAAAVSVDGLSKSLGYGGLRVGWIATRNRAVKRGVERWLELITGGPSVFSNVAAIAAFDAFDRLVAEQQCRVLARAGAVYEALHRHGWTFEPPALGLALVASPPRPLDVQAVAHTLDAGYFVLPVSVITGDNEDGAMRFSLLTDAETIDTVLRRLGGEHLG